MMCGKKGLTLISLFDKRGQTGLGGQIYIALCLGEVKEISWFMLSWSVPKLKTTTKPNPAFEAWFTCFQYKFIQNKQHDSIGSQWNTQKG